MTGGGGGGGAPRVSFLESPGALQGLWWDEPAIFMLPGATAETLATFAREGFPGLQDLPQLVEALHRLPAAIQSKLTRLLDSPALAKEWAQVFSLICTPWLNHDTLIPPHPPFLGIPALPISFQKHPSCLLC